MTSPNSQLRHAPGRLVEGNRREIERAISRVKGYRRGYWPPRLCAEYPRQRRRQPDSLPPFIKREQLWGRKRASSLVDRSDRVNVIGKVPREFFRWLKDQADTDWVAREMLEQCFFEER